MYCSNCGEKIADDSKFCYKCGKKTNVENATNSQTTINTKETQNQPQTNTQQEYINNFTWYNIYNYVVIPLLIIFNLGEIANLSYDYMDTTTLTTFAMITTFIAIKIALCISMYNKKQGTLKLLKISIYLEFGIYILGNLVTIIYSDEITLMLTYLIFILISAIWVRQNIIYFEKRKHIFIN